MWTPALHCKYLISDTQIISVTANVKKKVEPFYLNIKTYGAVVRS